MRVIAGEYKGQKLLLPKTDSIRPTKPKIREAIFSSIQDRIYGSVFVDLFAGTGAMGIEAISRGAEKVYFIDNSSEAINLIKKNTESIREKEKFEIINSDYSKIKTLEKNSIDIIYIDPPYEKINYEKIVKSILSAEVLREGGLMIIERNKDVLLENIIAKLGAAVKISRSKKYGSSLIDFVG